MRMGFQYAKLNAIVQVPSVVRGWRSASKTGRVEDAEELQTLLHLVDGGNPDSPAASGDRHAQVSTEEALQIARVWADSYPGQSAAKWFQAKALRRMDRGPRAIALLNEGERQSPYDADFSEEIGRIHIESGDLQAAISAWERSLELDPDNASLQHRVEFARGKQTEPWHRDIPDVRAIAKELPSRVESSSGANLTVILDHEVSRLYSDGATTNLRTYVARSSNEVGRDQTTRYRMTGQGRKRLLEAFAHTSDGTVVEASSIRGDEIRFRGLDVGSTVFVQYREDSPARGYLSKYLTQGWTFDRPRADVLTSEWVLWLPSGTPLNQSTQGSGIEARKSDEGDLTRYTWRRVNSTPIPIEANMPPLWEAASRLSVSTVPAWDFFVEWETALLEDVFRDSPVDPELADDLQSQFTAPAERLRAIHEYVMQEIRYQQDYENMVAGVKPHPAPTVVERMYGDCKDKTVLFAQLARRMGIEVHFALIRTRMRGPVSTAVPSQQFNHVIPYIPKQPGVAEGYFIDPTADGLDIRTLRHDDAGTTSLVYSPWDQTFR